MTDEAMSWRVRPYVEMLQRGESFSQANYGDGEWSCILGREGENSQGGRYTPELRAALIRTLTEPRFTFFGSNPGKALWNEAWEWCARNWIVGAQWVHKEMLSAANVHGELAPFVTALRQRPIVIVGPAHLRGLDLFKPIAFIEVPLPGAQDVIPGVVDSCKSAYLQAIRAGGARPHFLFSCGMATKVIMWELWGWGFMSTMIDCGAIWDPYVGVYSRSRYKWPEVQERIRAVRREVLGL